MRDLWLGCLALLLLSASLGVATNPGLPLLVPPLVRARPLRSSAAYRLYLESAALFVDAREPLRYLSGHIPGALQLSPGELERNPQAAAVLGRRTPLVLYCDGPDCGASARLADLLARRLPERELLILKGGWPAWEEAGYPSLRGLP